MEINRDNGRGNVEERQAVMKENMIIKGDNAEEW